MLLRYLAGGSIVVAGPITGRHYRFSIGEPLQAVVRADAERLMATGLFKRN